MAAESNVGARLFLIGKGGVLTGLKEIQAATAKLNAEIAAGARSSKIAAAGYEEQAAGLEALGVKMDLYQKNLARVSADTDAMAVLGKRSFLALGAAAAAWTYESVKWAQAYQTQLVQLRTQAGLTVTAMNAIGTAAMKNSVGLGISPTTYLQAAYHPASTGMSTRETISITNYGAKLAGIGGPGTSVEDTTNALTGVMKSYGMGAGQTGHAAAVLNAIVGAGNMHYSDLNAALSSGVASTAKTFGVNLTSLGSALAFATDRGVPAAQAGTRLRMAMSLIGAPSGESSKFLTAAGLTSSAAHGETSAMSQALSAAGLSSSQLASAQRHGGIAGALQLLHKDLTGNGVSTGMQAAFLSRAFGGGRMGTAIMQMYDNVPGLQKKQSQIGANSTSAKFNQDWISTTKTFTFQMHELDAEVHKLGITFGQELLPPLTKVVGAMTDVLTFFDKNKSAALALGGAVTAVLVPAIGVYLYRSLLSSGGAIRSVISAYARLMGAQSAEQVALTRTDASLIGNDAALATNDKALLTNALASKADTGGALGLGSKLFRAAGYAAAGQFAAAMVPGNVGSTLTNSQTSKQQLETMAKDALKGAGIGASIGSVVPGVGTALGAGIGAIGGEAYGARHQIGSALNTGWDDLFGGGGSSKQPNSIPRQDIHLTSTLQVDGKTLATTVQKYTKGQAARN